MRKKVVSAILCASMVAGMVVIPGVAVKADDKKLIGVTMPTKDLQRWNQDGENMKKELEAAGYEVDLQYASNDVSTQVSQLEIRLQTDVIFWLWHLSTEAVLVSH